MRYNPSDRIADSIVVIARGQTSAGSGPEVTLLGLKPGSRFTLEGVGARVWRLLQSPQSIQAILDRISEEYEVNPDQCRQDLLELLEKLTAEGFVEVFPPLQPENTGRNLSLTRELLRVMALLEKAGIRAISFKGPVLAAQYYGEIGLRQFGDLDILVSRRDVPRAQKLLLSNGYRTLLFRWFDPHCQLLHPEGKRVVELHRELMPRTFYVPFDWNALWDRSELFSLIGTEVRTLSAEDLLLFLCAHGAKHLWERMVWVCDVAQILRARPQLDWDRLLQSAREAGAERMLLLGLFLAQDLMGVELPVVIVRKASGDAEVKRLVLDMKDRLLRKAIGPFGVVETLPFYLRMRERWGDRIRDSFWHAVVVTVSLRPVRRMVEFGGRLWKRSAEGEI